MKNSTITEVELGTWTQRILAWFKDTGRKYLGKDLREGLADRGAKWCPRCERVLLAEAFGKQSGKPQGLRTYCKGCVNNEQRDHNRQAMRDRRANDPEYYQRELEQKRQYRRNRYHNDPEYREQMLQYQHQYRRNQG